MLANGDWQRHLRKELKNVPKSLKLYEAKLSKGEYNQQRLSFTISILNKYIRKIHKDYALLFAYK